MFIGSALVGAESLPRKDVEQLVNFDPLYNKSMTYEEWRAELRTRPDIKPDIFAMIDQERIEGKENRNLERMGRALGALQERTDLTPDELGRILDPLREYSVNEDSKDQMAKSFVSPGLRILKHYPSSANEDLALKFLRFHDTSIQFSALITLDDIGTTKSIADLNDYVNRTKPAPGNVSRHYDAATDAIRSIERRTQEEQRSSNQKSSGAGNPAKAETDRSSSSSSSSLNQKWPWLAAVIALLAASFGYLKLRKSS